MRTFTIATAGAFGAATLAVLAIDVRSYSHPIARFGPLTRTHAAELSIDGGVLTVCDLRHNVTCGPPQWAAEGHAYVAGWATLIDDISIAHSTAFRYEASDISGTGYCDGRITMLAGPLWAAMLLLVPWPVAVIVHALWRRRHDAWGNCRRRGYDLRGTPDRCPECGLDVAGRAA